MVWDVAAGEIVHRLGPGRGGRVRRARFTDDGLLVTAGQEGLRRWDLASGTEELLLDRELERMDMSADGRHIVVLGVDPEDRDRRFVMHLETKDGQMSRITTHGDRVREVAVDRAGTLLVTGDADGVIRVGSISAEEPHLMYGHIATVERALAVSPDTTRIASGSVDTTVRLWPMPDLSKPPLHTLPREELIAKLKTLTNLRVVHDPDSATGWSLEVGPFPGWDMVPSW